MEQDLVKMLQYVKTLLPNLVKKVNQSMIIDLPEARMSLSVPADEAYDIEALAEYDPFAEYIFEPEVESLNSRSTKDIINRLIHRKLH